jgi:hypothetical protein
MSRPRWTASAGERCDACDRVTRCAVWLWRESDTVRFALCAVCVRGAAYALARAEAVKGNDKLRANSKPAVRVKRKR